jgi:hypothetical protein
MTAPSSATQIQAWFGAPPVEGTVAGVAEVGLAAGAAVAAGAEVAVGAAAAVVAVAGGVAVAGVTVAVANGVPWAFTSPSSTWVGG